MNSWTWVSLMAFRDFRKNRAKLLLFVTSIIAGIAALVAIQSFGDNLKSDINRQAKELLGADLVFTNNKPIEANVSSYEIIDSAAELSFGSMVLHEKSGESRLTQVRALEGNFPFYGKIKTDPEDALQSFRSGEQVVLAEALLLLQLDADIGDSLRIGNTAFKVVGTLEGIPGQSGIVSTVAPAALIPMSFVEATGLIQYGSRVNYANYLKIDAPNIVEKIVNEQKEDWEESGIRHETVEMRKESTGRALGNLADFLSLVAFIALLLGSIGVGSSVNVFVREKLGQVGVLRCLGVSAVQSFAIFFLQIMLMAVLGSAGGAILGTLLQYALPYILGDFLPVQVQLHASPKAIAIGLLTGVLISALFSIRPLLRIRSTSPMVTLRPEGIDKISIPRHLSALIYGAIFLFIFAFAYLFSSGWKTALAFTLFVGFAFGLLWGAARLLMWSIRKFAGGRGSYPVRQALANLYRPNNQTIPLIVTIGLGTALISTLFFLQSQLLDQVRMADKESQPNLLLFDIQDHQIDDLRQLLVDEKLPILQEVPIVTMRLLSINGLDKKANEALEEAQQKSKSLYNREYRNTYRDSLLSTESIVAGRLRPYKGASDSLFISVEKGFADRSGLRMGDEMIFNVQGRQLTTYIGSLREIKVNQVSTIFLFLFPEGVLEKAPKFHVLITRTESDQRTADIQRKVVKAHPNVSAINLAVIVDTLEDILYKVGFVIQFMALFSIITGFLVLLSALLISRFQRMKESILLRTLGASHRMIKKIYTLEFVFLGSLATLSGLVLSFTATWALSVFVFEFSFQAPWMAAWIMYFFITGLILVIALYNSRKILHTAPMDILRGDHI